MKVSFYTLGGYPILDYITPEGETITTHHAVSIAYIKAVMIENALFPKNPCTDSQFKEACSILIGEQGMNYNPQDFTQSDLEEVLTNIIYNSKRSILEDFPKLLTRLKLS